ncbi:MAG: hypothetical protein C4524_15395 [Candidatus Zixiibacteriota bacterium]|nr:MAG: hypothetical protein C4524_15395 [candidate division Zixibacteria bacterium]
MKPGGNIHKSEINMAKNTHYTMASWRVKLGRENEFHQAWKDLRTALHGNPHAPYLGKLLQNTDDPQQFHSFAAWDRLEDIQTARNVPVFQQALQSVRDLCDESHLFTYRVIEEFLEDEPAEVL